MVARSIGAGHMGTFRRDLMSCHWKVNPAFPELPNCGSLGIEGRASFRQAFIVLCIGQTCRHSRNFELIGTKAPKGRLIGWLLFPPPLQSPTVLQSAAELLKPAVTVALIRRCGEVESRAGAKGQQYLRSRWISAPSAGRELESSGWPVERGSAPFPFSLCRAEAVGIQGRSAFPRAVRLRGSSLLAGQKRLSEAFPGTPRAPRPPALRTLQVLPLILPVRQLELVAGESERAKEAPRSAASSSREAPSVWRGLGASGV